MLALTLALLSAAPRPVLVTVDDLPMTGPARQRPIAERKRLHDQMLAALRKHRIRAVGLVTWRNVQEGDLPLLERWVTEGHELGNHSHSHLDYTRTDAAAYLEDVEKGRAALAELLARHGKEVRFFRFPFLREGDTEEKLEAAREYLEKSKQRNLPVTLDAQDWSFEERFEKARGRPSELSEAAEDYHAMMRAEIRAQERTGDELLGRQAPQILLLHAGAVGAREWDRLLGWLERTGHRFATADEVLADEAFSKPVDFVGPWGPGLWDRMRDARERQRVADEILALIRKQAEAWNAGDLEAFCSVYADDALFLSPSGVTRGREFVLARYKKRYPDKKAMGTLSFEFLEKRLGKGLEVSHFGGAVPSRVHQVTVAAKWKLSYPDKPEASGHTLIVFQPRGGRWEIVQDAWM